MPRTARYACIRGAGRPVALVAFVPMLTGDAIRAMALGLRETSERPAPRGGHPQFMTNGKCFAALPDADRAVEVWTDSGWGQFSLASMTADAARGLLEQAWRHRATKRAVTRLDYQIGADDLSEVFAELRALRGLTEREPGWYDACGKAFLHFHHSATSRHADVKEGKSWGEPIPLPLGRPSPAVRRTFLAEVRRRLAVTTSTLGK